MGNKGVFEGVQSVGNAIFNNVLCLRFNPPTLKAMKKWRTFSLQCCTMMIGPSLLIFHQAAPTHGLPSAILVLFLK